MKSLDQMILNIRTALVTSSPVNWGTLKKEIETHKDKDLLQDYLVRNNKSPALEAGDRHVIRLLGLSGRDSAMRSALRWIPAGTFWIGESADIEEDEVYDWERLQHKQTRGFWMMETPVTQRQYLAVMGHNPSMFIASGLDAPVECVNWFDAAAYANRLSRLDEIPPSFVEIDRDTTYGVGNEHSDYIESLGWRLPTADEWEYACMAGTASARYGELHQIAWYDQNSDGITHPVGQKQANAWGLYDMLGNVWEWCYDRQPETESSFMMRGGASWNSAEQITARRQGRHPQNMRSGHLGFRLVCNERSI